MGGVTYTRMYGPSKFDAKIFVCVAFIDSLLLHCVVTSVCVVQVW